MLCKITDFILHSETREKTLRVLPKGAENQLLVGPRIPTR